MGCRTCIHIVGNEQRSGWLYNHDWGSPAWTGAAILQGVVNAFGTLIPTQAHRHRFGWSQLANVMLRLSHPQFELTEEEHGDCEHLYVVDVSHHPFGDPIMVGWVECKDQTRPLATHLRGSVEYGPSKLWMPILDFVDVVNQDRANVNRRAARMRATNPGTFGPNGPFSNWTDLPPISKFAGSMAGRKTSEDSDGQPDNQHLGGEVGVDNEGAQRQG